jgi:hypothetical protein
MSFSFKLDHSTAVSGGPSLQLHSEDEWLAVTGRFLPCQVACTLLSSSSDQSFIVLAALQCHQAGHY